MIWEEELSQMMVSPRFYAPTPPTTPTINYSAAGAADFYDYEQGSRSGTISGHDYEEDGGNDDDWTNSPVLNPNYVTIQRNTIQMNGALRALSHLTKATQGVVVLLCSERSLIQVFRAAQQLRLLNGDYVFILVGPHSEVSGGGDDGLLVI
jgi:hypothetical protein